MKEKGKERLNSCSRDEKLLRKYCVQGNKYGAEVGENGKLLCGPVADASSFQTICLVQPGRPEEIGLNT